MSANNRDIGWFKSRRSNSGSDNCVECRIVSGAGTGVRDSKDRWRCPLDSAVIVGFLHRTGQGGRLRSAEVDEHQRKPVQDLVDVAGRGGRPVGGCS
ncbi:DUF397 domain-containing protein [Saccharopolyspora sp. 5N102]|uniref:DUF397 domain-containing protein n=1 Tax=Saccharopolyspora sp. 5N102 TaxID=3375155 RepID=UPI003799A412